MRQPGQNVYGIGYDEQNARKPACVEFGDDRTENLRVFAHEIQPRFPGFLIGARRDDDDGGVFEIVVIARVNVHGFCE